MSAGPCRPTAFSLGTDEVIHAWADALIGRTVGGGVLVVSPPATACGAEVGPSVDLAGGATPVSVIGVRGAR